MVNILHTFSIILDTAYLPNSRASGFVVYERYIKLVFQIKYSDKFKGFYLMVFIYASVILFSRFTGGDWISLVTGGGSWEMRTTVNLTTRSDTGTINSSPNSAMPPIVRVQHGCNATIEIPGSSLNLTLSRDMIKPTKGLCAQSRLRSAWASAQSDQSLR